MESDSICITTGIKHTKNIKYETEVLKKSLSELLEFAEKYEIRIAMEYEPGLLIEKSDDVFELTSDFKNLGLNLDTCHVGVFK